MIKVGLTGGIGSGKTTIAHFFKSMGVPVYFSDDEAKRIISNNQKVKASLIKLFGEETYNTSGQMNKAYISKLIFNNTDLLKQMNHIVHPAVQEHFNQFCSKNNDSNFVIKESAILIETGLYKNLDQIILVVSDQKYRIDRVVQRDNISIENIKSRISKQMKDSDKLPFADFVIHNNNEELMIPVLLDIYQQLSIQ